MNRGKNPTYNQLNETIEYLGEYYINLNKNAGNISKSISAKSSGGIIKKIIDKVW